MKKVKDPNRLRFKDYFDFSAIAVVRRASEALSIAVNAERLAPVTVQIR